MSDKPQVQEGDWIDFGPHGAVVSQVYPKKSACDGNLEIISADPDGKEYYGDVAWKDGEWEWVMPDHGGYPKNISRMNEFLQKFRKGRWA